VSLLRSLNSKSQTASGLAHIRKVPEAGDGLRVGWLNALGGVWEARGSLFVRQYNTRLCGVRTTSLMWWCRSVCPRVQSVGMPESKYVLHPRMSRSATRVPPSVSPATVATSECEEYGLSKSVVVMTILDPAGQSTASASVTCESPGWVERLEAKRCIECRVGGCDVDVGPYSPVRFLG